MHGFPARHVLVACKNDEGRMFIDGIAVVTHFAHKAGVAVIDGARDDTEVTGVIVEGVAVDMVDDLFFLAVRHFVVICSHNEQGYGYMPGATIDLKFQMVVLIEISVVLDSFFVREKIDACFATLCIEDGYLLIFDADVEDAPEDECRYINWQKIYVIARKSVRNGAFFCTIQKNVVSLQPF